MKKNLFPAGLLMVAISCGASLEAVHAAVLQAELTASVNGYTAIRNGPDPIPQSLWVPLSVTRNDSPGHMEASGEGGSFVSTPITSDPNANFFSNASATGFASAEPGVLRVYGSTYSLAQNYSQGPNLPGLINPNTVYSQTDVSASFIDYLTVEAPGLAFGTPVSIRLRYGVHLVSDYPLGYPPFADHPITAYAGFTIPGFGAQNFSTESSLFPFFSTTLPNGNGLYTIDSNDLLVSTSVGDILTIGASFGVFGRAYIIDSPNRQPEFGGFVDGRNTAGVWLGQLPDGVVISSASGHDYRLNPFVSSVPLPATLPMLLTACTWLFARKRRRIGAMAA